MKFIVDRQTWYRGRGSSSSALLRSDGRKCCLGFFCLACGYSEAEILNRATPGNIKDKSKLPEKYRHAMPEGKDSTTEYWKILDTNDTFILIDSAREEKLKKCFEKLDIEVEFINLKK